VRPQQLPGVEPEENDPILHRTQPVGEGPILIPPFRSHAGAEELADLDGRFQHPPVAEMDVVGEATRVQVGQGID